MTGTARARVDCGLSHRCPGKAAMPPPSQRRPIPKRRLASLPEKSRPHGTGQREISLPTCTVRTAYSFQPHTGSTPFPHTKTAPAIAQSVRFRHCIGSRDSAGLFPCPVPCFTQAGRQGRGPADSRYGGEGLAFRRPPAPEALGRRMIPLHVQARFPSCIPTAGNARIKGHRLRPSLETRSLRRRRGKDPRRNRLELIADAEEIGRAHV